MSKEKEKGTKDKKIRKVFSIFVAVIVALSALIAVANTIIVKDCIKTAKSYEKVQYEKTQLVPEKDKNGNWVFTTDESFNVMQLTDIHLGGGFMSAFKDKKAINAVAAMITAEKPDLVVITGDVAYPVPVQAGTFNNKSGAMELINLMETLGVYWTVTFGNHDSESYSYYEREKVAEFYSDENLQYCLFQAGPKDIDGFGNHTIEVKNSKGLITQAFIMIDSLSYIDTGVINSGLINGLTGKYDNIHDNQVEWYKTEIERMNAENKAVINSLQPGENGGLYKNFGTVKTQCFFHIPLVEVKDAWSEFADNGFKDTENVKYIDGILGEPVCCGLGEDNLFEAMVELGSTKAVHNGHDHYNNVSFSKDGIIFSYGYSIDYLAYIGIKNEGSQRGCTVITCNPDTSFEINKYNYYSDKYEDTFLPKESVEMQFEDVTYQVPIEE